MHYFFRNALAVLFLAATASCASIVSKSTYPVTINTDPKNVHISIVDNNNAVVFEGLTPVSIPLKAGSGYFKNAEYEIILSQEGYKPHRFYIEAQIDGWYFGNIVFGNMLGMLVVDPLTGAMWKLPAEYYSFTLEPATDEASLKQLQIIPLDAVPQELRSKMEMVKAADQP